MAFCTKCGTELTSEDLFCPNCGLKIGPAAPNEADTVPAMTKEESIALAVKLTSEYGALEKLKHEIDEAELIIKRPIPEAPRHAAFKFFWPFLIIGFIVYILVYLVVGLVFALGGTGEVSSSIGAVAGFVALAATLILGGNFARNQRDKMNNQEAMRIHTLRGKVDQMKKRTSELKTSYSVKKRSLEEYDAIVPESRRNRASMEKVRILLDSGKADTFCDALKL